MKNSFAGPDLGQLFRLCHVIRWMLLTFLVVQVGFFILAWVMPSPIQLGPLHVQFDPQGGGPDAIHNLDGVQRVIGVLIGMPGLLVLTYGVLRLGQTLTAFQNGTIFAVQTIGHLRAFAGATLIASVLFNVEKPLRNMTLNLASGGVTNFPIPIEVTSNELLLLLVCGLFYLIVGVMQEGRRLSEENEGFV
jgi:hypothetical protein